MGPNATDPPDPRPSQPDLVISLALAEAGAMREVIIALAHLPNERRPRALLAAAVLTGLGTDDQIAAFLRQITAPTAVTP